MHAMSIVPFGRVLVLSGSEVFQGLLRLICSPHVDSVLVAATLREGRDLIDANDVELVVTEVELPDGEGFELLEQNETGGATKLGVILVSASPTPEEERRALETGACAYLTKPVSSRQIVAAMAKRAHGSAPRAPRRRPGGRSQVLSVGQGTSPPSAQSPQIAWYVRDVSTTGAFIETESPIPVGSILDMELELGAETVRVKARVVRIQEPLWGRAAGVGVAFTRLGEREKLVLDSYVSAYEADRY